MIAAFAMLGWAVKSGGVGPVFSQPANVTGNAKSWAWVMSINVAVSGKTTLALNIVGRMNSKGRKSDASSLLTGRSGLPQSDLTRYGNKPSVAYWQLLFIPVVYWSFSFVGIVITSAGYSIYGTLY